MRVIARPAPVSTHRLAVEILLRAVAIAFAAVLILGLLPAIAEAAA